jgi:hypothetical protein
MVTDSAPVKPEENRSNERAHEHPGIVRKLEEEVEWREVLRKGLATEERLAAAMAARLRRQPAPGKISVAKGDAGKTRRCARARRICVHEQLSTDGSAAVNFVDEARRPAAVQREEKGETAAGARLI